METNNKEREEKKQELKNLLNTLEVCKKDYYIVNKRDFEKLKELDANIEEIAVFKKRDGQSYKFHSTLPFYQTFEEFSGAMLSNLFYHGLDEIKDKYQYMLEDLWRKNSEIDVTEAMIIEDDGEESEIMFYSILKKILELEKYKLKEELSKVNCDEESYEIEEKIEIIEKILSEIEKDARFFGVGYYDDFGNFVCKDIDDFYFRNDVYTYRVAVKINICEIDE